MNQKIHDIISKFESDLTDALKSHALESVTGLLGGVAIGGPVKARARAKSVTNGHNPPNRKARKGAKRSPEELEALTKSLLAAIKKSKGVTIETIGKELGVATKDLALPVQKLWEAKAIRTTGQKRATKYFAK